MSKYFELLNNIDDLNDAIIGIGIENDRLINKIAALQADNARLREALIGYHSIASGVLGVPSIAECAKKASSALAATPEQSLARLRNGVLGEAAKALDDRYAECYEREIREAAEMVRAMKEPT